MPVDETAGTPTGIHRPAQQAYMLVIPGIFKSVFTQPFRHVRQFTYVKFRADFSALATMADDTCIAALAKYKSKRINKNGLSCAGFAGKDGKTGNEFELYPIDNDEITNA